MVWREEGNQKTGSSASLLILSDPHSWADTMVTPSAHCRVDLMNLETIIAEKSLRTPHVSVIPFEDGIGNCCPNFELWLRFFNMWVWANAVFLHPTKSCGLLQEVQVCSSVFLGTARFVGRSSQGPSEQVSPHFVALQHDLVVPSHPVSFSAFWLV